MHPGSSPHSTSTRPHRGDVYLNNYVFLYSGVAGDGIAEKEVRACEV